MVRALRAPSLKAAFLVGMGILAGVSVKAVILAAAVYVWNDAKVRVRIMKHFLQKAKVRQSRGRLQIKPSIRENRHCQLPRLAGSCNES